VAVVTATKLLPGLSMSETVSVPVAGGIEPSDAAP